MSKNFQTNGSQLYLYYLLVRGNSAAELFAFGFLKKILVRLFLEIVEVMKRKETH